MYHNLLALKVHFQVGNWLKFFHNNHSKDMWNSKELSNLDRASDNLTLFNEFQLTKTIYTDTNQTKR